MKLYEKITSENWHKGSYRRRANYEPVPGAGCLMYHALSLYGLRHEALDRLHDAVRVLFPERGDSVPRFNDHADTTLGDVIRVCKIADV